MFEKDELDELVTSSAARRCFASRFRECAARALLLPRRNPSQRSPLWQQRQRASQLLEVAREFPTFPIILETVREVLGDVYDLPNLHELTGRIRQRAVRIVEVETPSPSPFSRSLLFGYVAAFLYEGDSPLAERRAAALSIDTTLLAELLGRAELREVLDPAVIDQTEAELQRLTDDRRVRDAEGLVDLLRLLGPQSLDELVERTSVDVATEPDARAAVLSDWLRELGRANRLLAVTIAGTPRHAVVEDAARLRDALGTPVPIGVPTAFLDSVPDPIGDLVARHARTHGPFLAHDVASRFGLGICGGDRMRWRRLSGTAACSRGEFRPGASGHRVDRCRPAGAACAPACPPSARRGPGRNPARIRVRVFSKSGPGHAWARFPARPRPAQKKPSDPGTTHSALRGRPALAKRAPGVTDQSSSSRGPCLTMLPARARWTRYA